jgi:hypothetical protein
VKALLGVVALVVSAVSFAGCGPACHPSERVVTEGVRITAGPIREFQTSPPDGPFLPFEGGTTLRIRHGLGVVPSKPVVYLSFTEHPLASGRDGYSQAAGNQAITLQHDDQEIAVWNGSCANYFIRVVITAVTPDDAGATDAAADTNATDTSVADAADGG